MEWYTSSADLVYGGCCLTLMVSFIICAVFRRWHICYPCEQNPDYYYPARREVCALFLSHLLYIPYLLHPSSHSTIVYASCVEVLILTTMLPAILIRFFKPDAHSGLRTSAVSYIIPLCALAIAGIYNILWPEKNILGNDLIFRIACGTVAFVYSLWIARIVRWMKRRIDLYHLAASTGIILRSIPTRMISPTDSLVGCCVPHGWRYCYAGLYSSPRTVWCCQCCS